MALSTTVLYGWNYCPYVYDPTNAAAQSQGSQNDHSLWPTLASWSNDPNDSGVYAAQQQLLGTRSLTR